MTQRKTQLAGMRAAFGIAIAIMSSAASSFAQKINGPSATTVFAELSAGKLNPAENRAGDQIVLTLKDDLKSKGEIVLRKGTPVVGIVRNVHRVEGQSAIQIEWQVPPSQAKGSHQVMLAVQSFIHSNSTSVVREIESSPAIAQDASEQNVSESFPAAVAPADTPGVHVERTTIRTSNTALLKMPTVVAADDQTIALLESALGNSGRPQLYETGEGRIYSAGTSKQVINIYSHFENDTILASRFSDFEIAAGAQMQLLVGVRKN